MNTYFQNIPMRLPEETAFRLQVKRDVGLDLQDLPDNGGVLLVHFRHRRLRSDGTRESVVQRVYKSGWAKVRAEATASPLETIVSLLDERAYRERKR